MTARSRGGSRPSSATAMPCRKARGRGECRMLAAPMSLKKLARLQQKTQAAVTTGSAETTGIPRAMVLTPISCSPRCTGLVGHRARMMLLASARGYQRRGIRTIRLHVRLRPRSSHAPQTSIASRLTCRDETRATPLCSRRDARSMAMISGKEKAEYFSGQGWTAPIVLNAWTKLIPARTWFSAAASLSPRSLFTIAWRTAWLDRS